ncbi:hypothetical protein RF11_03147 [Thelohanellus kitauei]|uniref:Uncharacterized protein n=1 Tax=Thelohanellus kitauei TaxID=669202 RepID=A0A0C2NFD8_THEKT|nr:hypothetical protein RF11_03147 [Thelohanellus kitauei]
MDNWKADKILEFNLHPLPANFSLCSTNFPLCAIDISNAVLKSMNIGRNTRSLFTIINHPSRIFRHSHALWSQSEDVKKNVYLLLERQMIDSAQVELEKYLSKRLSALESFFKQKIFLQDGW